MNSIERNRQLANEFFARFTANDIPGALETLSDDATWWIAGKRGSSSAAGTHGKDQIARIFHAMNAKLKNGLAMTVKSSVAEGDKVALEVESRGELINGRVYNNEYHTLMTIADGRITEVREYLDTQHVSVVWFAP